MDKRQQHRKRAKRVALVATVGSLAGFVCTFLPQNWQVVCLAAAKLIGLLSGAP